MRIVAGRWKGRRIDPPPDSRVRPTADRVREAWMSIVNAWLPGARVLDLFAGSGALGLEALSRGAAVSEFVEVNPRTVRAIHQNAAALEAGEQAVIHRADALRFVQGLDRHAFDVAFADPPYGTGLSARIAEAWLARPFAHLIGVEHGAREPMPAGGDTRRYGNVAITFYGGDAAADPSPSA